MAINVLTETPQAVAEALAPADADTIAQIIEHHRERIATLENRVRDLRQRLIGGVEGVKARRDLAKWAAANDRHLQPITDDVLDAFGRALENPPPASDALKALMRAPAPWDRS